MIRFRYNALQYTAAGVCALALLAANAAAQPLPPAGETVATFVNRVYLNPPAQAIVAGYFAAIKGLPGPLFAGTPGESSAYFTWTLDSSGAQLVTNGDTSVALLREDESMYVYFNPVPNQSWSDPKSFATGQLIAILRSSPGTSTSTGPAEQVVQSYALVHSNAFSFGGKLYDLRDFIPHGITFVSFGSNIPQSPAAGYPLVFTAAGSGIAVGGKLSAH